LSCDEQICRDELSATIVDSNASIHQTNNLVHNSKLDNNSFHLRIVCQKKSAVWLVLCWQARERKSQTMSDDEKGNKSNDEAEEKLVDDNDDQDQESPVEATAESSKETTSDEKKLNTTKAEAAETKPSAAADDDNDNDDNDNDDNNIKDVNTITIGASFERPSGAQTFVVSGANGFVAQWTIKFLLDDGHTVHGTVRDKDGEKYQFLKELEGAKERLKLFSVPDLAADGAFDEALEGADFALHLASPYILNYKNAEEELIKPAVEGLLVSFRFERHQNQIYFVRLSFNA
jgi:hypothetical protein